MIYILGVFPWGLPVVTCKLHNVCPLHQESGFEINVIQAPETFDAEVLYFVHFWQAPFDHFLSRPFFLVTAEDLVF